MAEKWVGNLRVDWDEEVDVLYVSISRPVEAVTNEARNKDGTLDPHGLLIRYDAGTPESGYATSAEYVAATHHIVGVTILDYEKKFHNLADMSWLETLDPSLPNELLEYLKQRPEPPK